MELDKLNEVYNEVLGTGPALEEEPIAGAPPKGAQDGAYSQEDYSDDAEDGTDPRDASTLAEEEAGEQFEADEPFEDEEIDDEEYEEIPERLVNAGRAANLSERDIVELSESHPEALEALARSQEAAIARVPNQQKSVKQEEPLKEAPAGGFEPIELDLTEDDREEMGERAVTLIGTLVDKVNALGGQVQQTTQVTENIQLTSEQEKIRAIDEHFDSLSEDIPGLGTAASLSATEKANRIFAFNAARAAMQAYGNMSLEQALTAGANALRGQMEDTQVKAKIVSDLNKNKKRFINRGRGQRRSAPRKSVDERAVDAISKVLDDPKYH